MNLSAQFKKCQIFIDHWKHFLDLEPIRNFPNFCPEEIKPWIDELESKSISEICELENNYKINTSYEDLHNLLAQIRDLINFPKNITHEEQHKLISPKIKKKKQHEIKQISSLINELDDMNLIDIGSGAAHLSENLINKRNRFSYCIDLNAKFQQSGKSRIAATNTDNSKKIEFKNLRFNEQGLNFSKAYEKSLVIGLHACGDLTSDIIHYFNKENLEYLIAIGCCYQHISSKYNLSSQAKKKPIELTTNARNLAARSYSIVKPEDVERKIKIRTYRYMLHCYLYKLGHKEFIPTGRTKIEDYEESFSKYAKKYAEKYIQSAEDAQRFYDDISNQNLVKRIIYTDLFRGLFGRVIEAYIVLDRALFLQENEHRVKVLELFNRHLSPRNLAIIVM